MYALVLTSLMIRFFFFKILLYKYYNQVIVLLFPKTKQRVEVLNRSTLLVYR